MQSLTSLTIRNLTAHPLRSILTALAIALGVAMVLAASIVGQAANQSATALSDEGQQVDLEIISRSDAPFDQNILNVLRAWPDIERVSPLLRVEALGVEPRIDRLTLIGVDPEAYQSLHKVELAGGAFLNGPETIVLPIALALKHSLNVGDQVRMKAEGGRMNKDNSAFILHPSSFIFTLSGRLKLDQDLTALDKTNTAFVPLAVAQALAGAPGQIDRLEIVLRPGADVDGVKADLARQLDAGLAVVRAEVAGSLAFNTMLIQGGLAMVGVIILFAAGFVILNAFAMSITARIQEIGALRALGMTRRQVMRSVLAEAGLLGLIGAGVGVLAGLGLAWGVMRVMGLLDDVPFIVPWWGVVFSPLMGLAVTLTGVLQPAWRASRVSPIVATRPETTVASGWYVRSGGRVGLALLLILLPALAAYALIARPDLWTAMTVTGVGIVALLGAMVLLLPALVVPLATFSRPILVRWLGTTGGMAADNLGRNKLRSALTVGALTAALTTIMAISGLLTLFFESGMEPIGMLHEDIFVLPDFAEMMASGEISLDNLYQVMGDYTFDPALVDLLDTLVEARVIELDRVGIASVPSELVAVPTGISMGMFVDPEVFLRIGNFDFFEGDAKSALVWMQRGRAVLLPPIVAERLGVQVGDTIAVETPHGEVDFTVAGVGGSSFSSPIFPYADGKTYFDLAGLFELGIVVAEGQDPDAVLAQVQEIVQPFPGVVVVKDLNSTIDVASKMWGRFQALLNALLLLAVAVAALGVVNTMVINVTERGREIGLLRAVGATQRQVRRTVVAEAMTLGLMAVFIATWLSLMMLLVYVLVVTPNGWASLGIRPDWTTTWNSLLSALRDMGVAAVISLIFGPLIAGLAAYYPAKQAAAIDVVTATRSEHVALTKTTSPRRESRRKMARSLIWTLALRSLDAHRTRAVLSALAVMLGVAITIAADVISGSILSALTQSEDMRVLTEGLTGQLASFMTLVGFAVSLTAGFLVFNTFAMSITQRRRQIGALRSLGMTRKQVMRLVLAEGLIIGGAGTLAGLLAGPLLGNGIVTLLKAVNLSVINAFAQSSAAWTTYLLAAGLGLGVTLLSVLLPARQATRVSPLVALQETGAKRATTYPRRWAIAGGAAISAIALYLIIAPPGKWILPPWGSLLAGLFALAWLMGLGLILPALLGGVGYWTRGLLSRLWGATGRLIADNLQRDRRRVTLTVITLSISIGLIVSMTGSMTFLWQELLGATFNPMVNLGSWGVFSMDITAGVSSYANLDSLTISRDAVDDVRQLAADRADVVELHYVIVPELSFMGDNYYSYVVDPKATQYENVSFVLTEGDWETAISIMEQGCGVMITPAVARKNGVWLHDTLTVSGAARPVECTVAGVGQSVGGASIISAVVGEQFGVTDTSKPMALTVIPLPGVDIDQLQSDLTALSNRRPDIDIVELSLFTKVQQDIIDNLLAMLNGMLLLAIVAAALGVVNTTMMSVAERRRELGLLRAVGATRQQVNAVVTGEAALMGIIGGALGLIAGAGIVVIVVLVYGGNAFGFYDLDLWVAAWRSLQPALLNGLIGLLAAPLIAAAAAWFPARSILRGSAIETMQPETQRALSPRRAVGRLWRWGSIRSRFALGTGLLMALTLAGLITAITLHARIRLQEQLHDAVRTMVVWNAGLVELNLPEEANNLTLETLAGSGGAFDFDSDSLLQFRSMMDGLSEQGLLDFTIADQDNVALISLELDKIGSVLPEAPSLSEADVYSEREEGKWLIHAAAPIRNSDGLPVGSVRLVLDAREIQGFLSKLRNALALTGGVIILFGLAVGWALTTPLVNAAHQLTAHAAETGRGEFTPFRRSTRFKLLDKLSLRAKLTAAMVFILTLMIVVLQLIAIPIERRRVEATLKRSLLSGAEWIGQAASESFEAGMPNLSPATLFSLDEVLNQTQTLDIVRLQTLTEQTRGDDMAYIALADRDGEIIISDQLELIGEGVPVPAATQIEAGNWRGDSVWIVSTPLRQGEDGEQIGVLRMAARREQVETFLNESRNLFWLTGLIAVLAGILLAQAIGGAVTAPVRELAAGTRRVAEGDLSVRFRAEGKDELAILANAYNQMVAGLREREWLRDMFGRFVSREVAEAIHSGQVKLKGENRVVSILFCDIRGFTKRSEGSTPEEVVALLNEYLPLVVGAAQQHGGVVNKFLGDGAMVIYGAPKAQQESAYQAIMTALNLQANLITLNAELAQRGEAPLQIGVGVNTGIVLAGAVGPKERQEYTVIGDTVNLASRIEALNKEFPDYNILISGHTYKALGSRRSGFDLIDLGEVQIRGKAEPVQVWGVLGKS